MSASSERTRRTVKLLLDSFRAKDLNKWCQDQGVEPAELASLRTSFIAGGTSRVHEILERRPWLQINITMNTLGHQWLLFIKGNFQDRIRSWVGKRAVDSFFFVHKPPGIRLRFIGISRRILPALEAHLQRMIKKGEIDGWSRGCYDAEVYQFGGEIGLDITHDFFTVESLAVLDYLRLRFTHSVVLEPGEFSLYLVNAFLRRVTQDEWELWDVWCRLELTGRIRKHSPNVSEADIPKADALRHAFLPVLSDDEHTLQIVSKRERVILDNYHKRLPRIAERLQRASETGTLLWGIRDILPFWIIFHWNRMGFDLAKQERLAFLMARILNPKQ
jgi:thiopeptide-type bacteriocin biosynthesis protein